MSVTGRAEKQDGLQRATIQHRTPDSKRRRLTRIPKACDDCRGRKTKCDGGLPCSSCLHYNEVCEYSKEVKPRYGGPQYTGRLENTVARLKFAIQIIAPEIDLDQILKIDISNPLEQEVAKKMLLSSRNQARGASWQSSSSRVKRSSLDEQELLDTMIEATGRLDIDSKGGCDYLGDFAGLSFLDRISRRCSQLINPDAKNEIPLKIFPPEAFDSPQSGQGLPRPEQISINLLPPHKVARQLTRVALKDACCLLQFIHQPSFEDSLDRIYKTLPENYTTEDQKFLALLYLTLALGELYSKSTPQDGPFVNDIDKMKGSIYFRAGQGLVDVMDCHDIILLQSILCMIIYFQSSGLMHSCYLYISLAIASAFRMGLHRYAVLKFFDPIQQETRKRTFWALQTMDTYVATMLGLPKNIRDEELDQEFPLDVDDEFITKDGVLLVPAQHMSGMAVVNAHTKLLLIMANVITDIYPNQKDLSREHLSYYVDYGRIIKVEADLEEWFHNVVHLPALDTLVLPEALRIQLLLRLAYAHVQMVLYRPFIQHLVRVQSEHTPNMKSYGCASACVKAAMQIIWLVDEMDKRELLIGAYWFTVYIMFFAIMSLCMFILGNTEDPTASEVMIAALKGRQILIRLASESASAARCVASLGNIFDRISSTSGSNSTVLSAVPAQTIAVHVSYKDSNLQYNKGPADTVPYTGSSKSLNIESIHPPILDNSTSAVLPPLSGVPLDRQIALSQPSEIEMMCALPMMPLAAFTQGLGEEEQYNLFPVFAPAWLDQASELQTRQLESEFTLTRSVLPPNSE